MLTSLLNVAGYQHRVNVQFCSCESECKTLYRHLLRPASPVRPKVAISLNLWNGCGSLVWNSKCQRRDFVMHCHCTMSIFPETRTIVSFCNVIITALLKCIKLQMSFIEEVIAVLWVNTLVKYIIVCRGVTRLDGARVRGKKRI